jgi:hypothetical protein
VDVETCPCDKPTAQSGPPSVARICPPVEVDSACRLHRYLGDTANKTVLCWSVNAYRKNIIYQPRSSLASGSPGMEKSLHFPETSVRAVRSCPVVDLKTLRRIKKPRPTWFIVIIQAMTRLRKMMVRMGSAMWRYHLRVCLEAF